MAVSRNKLTRKDIDKMSMRSLTEQLAFSFERMQAIGFCENMGPALKKIYGDNKEELAKAMQNNIDFINTEPHMATMLQGLVLSMEEKGANRSLILNIKNALFGPLAGLGDAIFWFTCLPINAAISCSLASQGNVFGPILYMIVGVVLALTRIWFGRLGYNLGAGAVEKIQSNAVAITKAAGILGVMVVGALIPSYVSLAFPEDLKLFSTVSVQGIFDSIMPNILPLGFVFLLYWLLNKKNANAVTLIFGIIIVSILLSLLGIL